MVPTGLVKAMVDSGAYKVNSRDVAEKMVAALSKENKRKDGRRIM